MSTDSKIPKSVAGRVILRAEGDWFVAYWSDDVGLPISFDGATELGRIRLMFVESNASRADAFIAMMRDVMGDLFESTSGKRPDWHEQPPKTQ